MTQTKTQAIQTAARLWTDPETRDVAEIDLDALFDADCEDAIVDIHYFTDLRVVTVTQESGIQTRIPV